jgi:hypothetical protein
MERAIFITKIKDIKYINSEYSRVYFGNEFCQRLIPSLEDLKKVLDLAHDKKMDFSLVTPFVTNEGLENLGRTVEFVAMNFPEAELIFNDWGVLRLFNQKYKSLKFVLGRLLTKQKRGPRILNVKDRVPESTLRHFMESNIDVPVLSAFLSEKGIRRVELDNLLQGLLRSNPTLKGSIYFPFAYVTTSRFCLASLCEKGSGFSRAITTCSKECQEYIFLLRHKTMPVDLFVKGNAQFFKNDKLPEDLAQLNIDRIVYEPDLPL